MPSSTIFFSSSFLPRSTTTPNPNHRPPISTTISSSSPLPLLNTTASSPSSLTTTILSAVDQAPSPCPTDKPWLQQGASVRVSTAPWMQGPLLLPADELSSARSSKKHKKEKRAESRVNCSLTDKVRGGRNRVAMRHIVRSVTGLRRLASVVDSNKEDEKEAETVEFEIPTELQVVCGNAALRRRGRPWGAADEEEVVVLPRVRKEKVVTAAERMIPKEVLRRLREEAGKMRRWVNTKKAGVTQEVVEEIRKAWTKRELVMVRFRLPLAGNMNRAREIVEIKTGGLVVWSKKDTLVVYRGDKYELSLNGKNTVYGSRSSSSLLSSGKLEDKNVFIPTNTDEITNGTVRWRCIEEKDAPLDTSEKLKDNNAIIPINADEITEGNITQRCIEEKQEPEIYLNLEEKEFLGSVSETLLERETNRLLDGLGPRFVDWWWRKPLPVDADLLPEIVPNYKPPFRRPPPRDVPTLRDEELTYLRKLAKALPTHFALGKNRKLQGLAAAIVKLWEKSPIAKIAVKQGVQNTKNERMSYELKNLTGGILILRNKFFIILYRGKDFLPDGVATLIFEREMKLHDQQLLEEAARSKPIKLCHVADDQICRTSNTGTLVEFEDIKLNHIAPGSNSCKQKIKIDVEKAKLEKELQEQERKLFILNVKIQRSEKELAKLNSSRGPPEHSGDQEVLTDEERRNFQNIGLRMDEFLLLGRRGVYDGVIGSIHQHWKHREVVKVITMQKKIFEVNYTAKLLEIESGGILVAVKEIRKGHIIILYRGKNYHRPLKLLPENLLTKREALRRSIELQRRGSLKFFARQMEQTVWILKQRLRNLEEKAKLVLGDFQEP